MSISSKLRMDGKDYDAPGYYFVTLCADERRHIFGRLVGEAIELSDVGQAAEACWHAIPEHFPDVELGAFVVMPDHVHGIVRITRWQRPKGVLAEQGDGRKKTGTRRGSLGSIIKGFKIGVTKACQAKTSFGHPIFQANYYDVICFDAAELAIKEAYIRANPQRLALKKVPRGTIKRSAYLGNLALLESEPKLALRVSRKATEAELAQQSAELSRFNGVVASTFFSPGEQRLLDELLANDTSRLIWIMPMGMPKQVPVKWGPALLRSRALWLSPYPEDMTAATRETCLACNEWAKRLATASRPSTAR
jgi:REP element-mobilizing transposase RayT